MPMFAMAQNGMALRAHKGQPMSMALTFILRRHFVRGNSQKSGDGPSS